MVGELAFGREILDPIFHNTGYMHVTAMGFGSRLRIRDGRGLQIFDLG